jgi:hypothetical protein
MTTPRKCRLDLATPPEVALRAALAAVEAMPADVRLTKASQKVVEALDLVGDYVNAQMCVAEMGYAEKCGLLVNGGTDGRCVRVRGHDARCVGDQQNAG